MLGRGVGAWNAWRDANPALKPDLSDADLRKADLKSINLSHSDLKHAVLAKARLVKADLHGAELDQVNLTRAMLRGANLTRATLRGADLSMSDLRKAELSRVDLSQAGLREARLNNARLQQAILIRTDLLGSNLFQAQLNGAVFSETILADTLLASARGIEACQHRGPSIIDYRTLQRSGPLPLTFLRGCGLPDNLIEIIPSLFNQPVQYYSCFISYASADEAFAQRLYADLQQRGVRCWFAPEDMSIGAKILDTLDEAIRLRDKMLLVLSQHAIDSEWVEDEVTKAFAEERARKQTVVFPIRIDNAVMVTPEAWAMKLRDNRKIGDFSNWKEDDAYKNSFERLLHDLKIDQDGQRI